MFRTFFARFLAVAFLFSVVFAPVISEANVHSEQIHSVECSQLLTPVIPKLVNLHGLSQEVSLHPDKTDTLKDFNVSRVVSDTASCTGCHAIRHVTPTRFVRSRSTQLSNDQTITAKNIDAGGHANRKSASMGSQGEGVFRPSKIYGHTGACKCSGHYLI